MDYYEKINDEQLFASLKNNSTFIRLLRGPLPELNVKNSKERLFERLCLTKRKGINYEELENRTNGR